VKMPQFWLHDFWLIFQDAGTHRTESRDVRRSELRYQLWPNLDATVMPCGQAVAQMRYKPEGRGFDSRWCHGIILWYNPFGRTMALGPTQPLTEMSTRNISWGVKAADV
jgi:hypothetical protein